MTRIVFALVFALVIVLASGACAPAPGAFGDAGDAGDDDDDDGDDDDEEDAGPELGPNVVGQLCTDDLQCTTGLCASFVCAVPCDAACDDGAECIDGACLARRDVRPPDLVLGPLVTTSTGPSSELVIDIPEDVIAFSVTLVDDDGLVAGAVSLTDPDGTALVDDVSITGGTTGDAPLQHASRYFGATTTLVPSTDDAAARVRAGAYRLRAATWTSLDPAAPPVDGVIERALVRLTRAGDEGGFLDLAVHFAPATGVTAETARDDVNVIDTLLRASSLLALAGVTLGDVTFHDLPVEDDVVADGNEARAICVARSVDGAAGIAANLFVVQDVSFTAGFAGGIPGPAGLSGTPASGVVAEQLGAGADTGVLVAHELGHFLGLRHTTEVSGSADFLVDTPVCPSGTNIQACPDRVNLMFPFFSLIDELVVSDGQARILRASPFLYEDRSTVLCPGAVAYDVTRDLRASATLDQGARLHVLRVTSPRPVALTVTAPGFTPVVVVREACDGAELARAQGDAALIGEPLVVNVGALDSGAYAIEVSALAPAEDDAAGTFTLFVE